MKRASVSEATLANYLDTLVPFGRFPGEGAPPLEELGPKHVADYLDDVKGRASASTAAMRYRGLSAVLGWLALPGRDEEPYIPSSPLRAAPSRAGRLGVLRAPVQHLSAHG